MEFFLWIVFLIILGIIPLTIAVGGLALLVGAIAKIFGKD